MSLTVDVHHDFEGIEEDWAALCARVGATPWHSPSWYRAWWESFGRGSLEIVTVRDEGRLTGLVPMERLGKEIRAAANSQSPDFGIVAEDEAAAQMLATALFSGGRRVNLFPLLSNNPASLALYDAANAAGFSLLDRALGGAPYVTITAWDSYLSTVDTKMVREIRRRRRRLEEADRLTLEISTEASCSDLEEFFDLEARGWKGAAGTAITSKPDTEAFYRRLCSVASDHGWLVAFLRSGPDLIAADLSFEVDRAHYLLKTSFDPDHARYGPGLLLRYLMLERAFDSDLVSYEFLGRDDPWKRNWTTTFRPLTHMRAFPPSARGTWERALFQLGRAD
jgi:CelD/BcsL family acetyltransferase involved in cellulose biosynthesis